MPGHWLIKSEPTVYPWSRFEREERAVWDGVRNFEARNHLRAMKVGDLCLFYHSNVGKEIVGVARVTRAAYPDPSAAGEDWSVVDVEPAYAFARPVTLATLKEHEATAAMQLVTRSRLSVTPVTAAEWRAIHTLGKTKPAPVTQRKAARAAKD